MIHEWREALESNGQGTADLAKSDAAFVLERLEQAFGRQMAEFREACKRPVARFPLRYDLGVAMPVGHALVLLNFAGVFCLHGAAELETGNAQEALEDCRVLDHIQGALQPDPLMISHLVRLSVLPNLINLIWQGNSQHAWSEPQLAELQNICSRIDVLSDHQRVVRGERALANVTFERFRRHPDEMSRVFGQIFAGEDKPWFGLLRILPQDALLYGNEATYDEWIQEFALPVIDAGQGRVDPAKADLAERAVQGVTSTPYNFMAKLSFPTFNGIARRSASAEVLARESAIACALERFRLKNGSFPTALTELVPEFLSAQPSDPFLPLPLNYRRTEDGSYIVYSVGWNKADDGGAIVLKSSRKRDDNAGDWVWFGKPRE